jgi:hypothetical protein
MSSGSPPMLYVSKVFLKFIHLIQSKGKVLCAYALPMGKSENNGKFIPVLKENVWGKCKIPFA